MKIAEALVKYADAIVKGDERAARATRRELEEALPLPLREAIYKYSVKAALTDDSRLLLARLLKAAIQPDVVDEKYRIALEAILVGMALRPKLLVDLLEGRRGGREIAVEALDALSRAVERAGGGATPLREQVVEAAKAGQIDERRLSAFARRIIEATPPSLRHLLHGLAEELRAGRTPREAVEALRPRLAELAREAAEAFKGAEDVDYLAKSFGARSSSEEEILRAFEDAFLRAAERLARLPEDQRRDVLEYIERRLGRLLKVVGIAALGVTLAVLVNDPSWLRRSVEAAVAVAGAHAALPVVVFAVGLAKRAGAEEAAEAAKSITAAEIKDEIWRRAEKLAKDIERAVAVRDGNVRKLLLDGAEIGRIVEEKIKKRGADTRLAVKMRDLHVELEFYKKKLLEITQSEELRKLGEGLGHKAFVAAARRFGVDAGVVERVLTLSLALEKYLKAELGERAEDVVEGMWHKIGKMWEDGVVHSTAFELLRKYFDTELMELLAEIEKKAEGVKEEARGIRDPYSRLPRELKKALVEAFLGRAPEVLGALRGEDLWALQEFDRSASEAKKLPELREYVERLEKIAAILKAAARGLAERAEGERRYGLVEANGKLYPAYEGPVKLSARVEHVTRDGKKYAVIEAKYDDRVVRVELEVEELRRSGLLHNLAAIATDDIRNFYEGYVSHRTASFVQASERLLMWAIFMPGEYALKVKHVYATKDGLSPDIEIKSRFGPDSFEKIEGESPIHRLVLKLARELAGRENLLKVKGAANKVLAASWLMISAILSTPEGGRPSEGLAVLVEKGVLPRAAFDRLRPIFEELDALLGSVSREDKAYLVGKMVDYDGNVRDGLLLVKAEKVKRMTIELGGVEINMADVALAAAKAFWMEGGWSGNDLSFGPAREALEFKVDGEAPLKIPAFKVIAVLIAQKADELRRKDLVEYIKLASYKVDGGEIKIIAAKAREGEQTLIAQENREAIWKEFKIGKYTHLRLVVRGEEYELFYSGGKFAIKGEKAQKLKRALEELGLDVKLTSGGRIRFGYERLEKLLNKGVEAYAVRKAKMGEAMWRLEITYKGMTMALEMYYNERNNCLEKHSETGKIEVFMREEGAAEGKSVELDLKKLADIKEGRDCGDCLEKRLAEAFTTASEKGFSWSVTSDREHLIVYLPSDFRGVVSRFYSNT